MCAREKGYNDGSELLLKVQISKSSQRKYMRFLLVEEKKNASSRNFDKYMYCDKSVTWKQSSLLYKYLCNISGFHIIFWLFIIILRQHFTIFLHAHIVNIKQTVYEGTPFETVYLMKIMVSKLNNIWNSFRKLCFYLIRQSKSFNLFSQLPYSYMNLRSLLHS